MKKTSKIILIISTIFSIISILLLSFLIIGIVFKFDIVLNAFKEAYILVFDKEVDSDISLITSSFIIYGLFGIIVNYFATKFYILFIANSKSNFLRTDNLYFISISQIVFGLSTLPPLTLISPIFAIIGAKCYNKAIKDKLPEIEKLKNSQTTKIQIPYVEGEEINPLIIEILSEKIDFLKKRLSKGELTKEEYIKQLNLILEGKE